MLGKLIKYDLKALAKILAPLWGVLLVMGLIFGISIRSNLDGIGNTMIVFSLVVIIAVIVAIFVMNVIIVIQRFWNGLLQEEGYLMFTLPVTTRSLILSKVISALIIAELPSTKPSSATANPVKALNSEITTGISAPPMGRAIIAPKARASRKNTEINPPLVLWLTATTKPSSTALAKIAILTFCWPEKRNLASSLKNFSSCNLPNATTEPENDTAPINAPATAMIRTEVAGAAAWLPWSFNSSTAAIAAAAPPPIPL